MLTLLAKPVLEARQTKLAKRVEEFKDRYRRCPRLAVILVGEDPASVIYTRRKGEAALSLGCEHQTLTFSKEINPSQVKLAVEQLNRDPRVDGILIQRPLPSTFSELDVLSWVSPEKDVDAFHPLNAGRLFLGIECFQPCTPTGVMALLSHYKIAVAGQTACVIGRSSIVGKPMAALLLRADATVIHCHSKTPDLEAMTQSAGLLIVAAGRPGLIKASHLREGATVIDVGMHRNSAGKLVGDVDFEDASTKASAISPVPGGVGPMTISVLMENTVWSAEQREMS